MERIPVTRSSMPPIEEYTEEIESLWESRWLTNLGEKHQRLKKEVASYLGVPHCSLFTNGHLALEAALHVLGFQEGEVITTPFTFASTTQAIVQCGLTPVFCDINEDDFTIDATKIEKLITPRTVAILPVHVYGMICHVEKISQIAQIHSLKVIYDAAHAFGEKLDHVGIGNFGDLSMFSFHATKVFHTIEGGCLTFHDEALAGSLRALKNFGMQSPDSVTRVAGNAKMNEFQAAMGLCNLRHLDEELTKRRFLAEQYRKRLAEVSGITIPAQQKRVQSNYAYFPILVDEEQYGRNRDELWQWLKEHEVYARKYFYPLTSKFECYQGRFPVQETPIAQKVAISVLTLPLFADMTKEQVEFVCDLVEEGQR